MTNKIPDWFNKDLAVSLNVPIKKTYSDWDKVINFGDTSFETKFCKLHKYNNKTNLFEFDDVNVSGNKFDLISLKKVNNKLLKINDKKSPKYKSLKTKEKNLTIIANGITKTKKYEIYPKNAQIEKLINWFFEAEKCYNKCVDLYNENNKLFEKSYKIIKLDIFQTLYGNDNKNCPYDILTDEVRKFCSNLKSCKTNLQNKNISNFNIKYLNPKRDTRTIFIPKTAVKNGSIYKTHLGKIEGLEELDDVFRDCTLTYSKKRNKFWLNVPTVDEKNKIKNRENICAIDPGEATFVSFCGENTFGDIGIYMRDIMLEERTKISQLQKIIKNGKNKNGKKLKNKGKLKQRIQNAYDRNKNITKELHNKTALFLCKNYERIIIPEFKTQGMLKKKYTKNYYNKMKEEGKEKEMKLLLRENTRKKRMNKKSKFVLNGLSHYKFRQHLINKGNEYGCEIIIGTEEYTTKTCTYCGSQEGEIKNRIKICKDCGKKINRDNAGARNILIKHIKKENIRNVVR